jgi:tetratricopeptide (TPR) repeat protein
MRPSRSITWIAGSLLAFFLAASALLVHQIDAMRSHASIEDVLYIRSSAALRRMSLGYTGLMADLYWTRAVQYYGNKHHNDADPHYELLGPLLNITTDLDPKLVIAYQFGASFLAPASPEGAGQPDQAVALLEKGIRSNPAVWRLYHALGFVQYMERKDYVAAADAFERGSRVPNAHPFLKLMAAKMAQKGGEFETARMLWTMTYDSSEDPMIKDNAAGHLLALQAEEDLDGLNKIIALYRQQTGRNPKSWRELGTANMLPGVPVDPVGFPYILAADGQIFVRHPEKIKYLHKGLPPGYKPSAESEMDERN